MRLILLTAIMALMAPAASEAIQLHWSSGSTSLTFTEATRCTLLVQADAAEGSLPQEWRLLWDATRESIRPVLFAPGTESPDLADLSGLAGPASPSDSSAHLLTAFFSRGSSSPAVARYVLDLPAGISGKFKAVALSPADPDSASVLLSNEVYFNGGVPSAFPPVVLHAAHTHGSEVISIRAIGDGLLSATAPVLVTREAANTIPLTIQSATQNSFVATGVLPDALPEADLQVEVGGRSAAVVPVTPDVVLGAQPASISSVRYLDPDSNVQPRDFAFVYNRVPTATPNVWRSLFHLIYTTLFRNQGVSSQTTFRHTWTSRPDIDSSWHTPVVTFTTSPNSFYENLIYAPTIVYFGGNYRMFYTGVDRNSMESIGSTFVAQLDTTNTVWQPGAQVLTPITNPVPPVSHPLWVAPPGGGFPGTMRDPYVLEDPDRPGNLLMYYVAGNMNDQLGPPPTAFFRNAVGVVRSQGTNLTQAWSDLGYFRSTDGQHGMNRSSNAESPHVFPDNAHADPGKQGGALWRLMFTNGPAGNDSTVRFEVAHGSVSDTTLALWQPTPSNLPGNLYDYLHQDPTVFGWVATEYVHVAPADFLGAYDGAGIPITRMYWAGTDFILGFPDVSVRAGIRNPRDISLAIAELAPGSGRVRLRIEVPAATRVSLIAYDVMGRRICSVADREVPAGRTVVSWDGRDGAGGRLESGVYFARLTCARGSRVVRIPLVH